MDHRLAAIEAWQRVASICVESFRTAAHARAISLLMKGLRTDQILFIFLLIVHVLASVRDDLFFTVVCWGDDCRAVLIAQVSQTSEFLQSSLRDQLGQEDFQVTPRWEFNVILNSFASETETFDCTQESEHLDNVWILVANLLKQILCAFIEQFCSVFAQSGEHRNSQVIAVRVGEDHAKSAFVW